MQDNFDIKNETALPPESDVTPDSAESGFMNYVPYGFTPKTYNERNGIKKAANAAGISFILLLTISFICSLIYTLFCADVNHVTGAIEYNENPAIQQAVQIIIAVFTFTVPFAVCYRMFGYRISDLVSFKRTEKGMSLPLFFFGVAFCAFSNIASSYMDSIFEAFGIDYSMGEYELPQGVFGFILTFLATAVVPAFVEEFALRGLVLGSLRKFGDGFALIASSVIFSVMHGNFEQIPFAFLVGLFLGFSVLKTNSLRVAMSVHFFNNFISVFFSYFLDDISVMGQNIIYVIFLLISLIFGMVFLKGNKSAELFVLKNGDTECSEKQKYKWFFISVPIIIFISLSLVESLEALFI